MSGITIKTAPHGANEFQTQGRPRAATAEALLKGSSPGKAGECKELLQSSLRAHLNQPDASPVYASSNGFVKGAIDAYNQHHHFVIRPEDVWFAILTQFSFYVNKNAEELRSKFVNHEGKKDLTIYFEGTRQSIDHGWFADEMGKLLEKNVVDPELREWISPDFSTTTREDRVVASVLMMGTLQKYFVYRGAGSLCGLPSVTLLGTEGDWENILLRLEKLKGYGKESTIWYSLLRPVLARFVKTFQSPDDEEVLDFWQRIVHHRRLGSGGGVTIKGWITAFCFWTSEGNLLYREPSPETEKDRQTGYNSCGNKKTLSFDEVHPGEKDRQKDWNDLKNPYLALDGEAYHSIFITQIPLGYGSVPVAFKDSLGEFEATMIAGSVGVKSTSSGKPLHNGQTGFDTVQPVSGWWMFENKAKG